ncbi:DNA repair protein REV1-like [Diospyros lotus]|uniref:DNA repair protein REV1-like n=1 Tax=Diospyros lotus TaxID=55363 RepID=UPI0022543C44|nr:DNA repair protein REV1-like [Diospyros lotus]XP_052205053.1 DNA repair protein REV1-like [Diospyros lotus]XP_052205054.1 DNA repair protein REV1-like [Diospyros lotus]XP_052205055.1 DNA repair protein REV1-like [Diospyros lotus]
MQHSEPTGGDDSVGKNIATAVSQGLVCIEREYSEGKLDKGSDVCIIGGNTAEIHNQASLSQPYVSECSRLHFIGTWRNRYYKRFPNFRFTSSNVTASTRRTSIIHADMEYRLECFFEILRLFVLTLSSSLTTLKHTRR